jgi:hypothetical protein
MHDDKTNILEFLATAFSLVGGALLVVPHWSGFAFCGLSSGLWVAFGCRKRHWGLSFTQLFFVAIDLIALYRIHTGVWHG